MGIQNWAEDIILVNLAPEPQMSDELDTTIDMVSEKAGINVVIDFSDVEIVTSSSIARLLRLHKALNDHKNHLVLCSVKMRTMGIFEVAGLNAVFNFVEDQFIALATLQFADQPITNS